MCERTPKSPPSIKALPEDSQRPLWSVMIPSYNCIDYLRESITSVLLQAPSEEEMQIEVIDDFSADGDVQALVAEIGQGRVSFFRQPHNVGSLRNFETCINRARGQLVHILHGDDSVKPGFYQEIQSLFNSHPEIGAAFTHCTDFDENNVSLWTSPKVQEKPGIVDNMLLRIAERLLLQPPAIVVKRSVYEHLGSFFGVHYGEDWEMWTRIAAHYKVAYSPKILANYRVHSNNITGSSFESGQNIKDVVTVINTIQNYLPNNKRKALKNKALQNYTIYITTTADWIYHRGNNPKAALLQAKEAFKLYPSVPTFYSMLKMSIKKLIQYKMKRTRLAN